MARTRSIVVRGDRRVPFSTNRSNSSMSRTTRALSVGAPTDGDLVTPNVDVAVERVFDHAEQFVFGAQQMEHHLLFGDDDLNLGVRVR